MTDLAAVLAGMTREHVFRGLADHASGRLEADNPHPGRKLDHQTIIGGSSYGARTLVVYAAQYGTPPVPLGELRVIGDDGVSDRRCRDALEALGFEFSPTWPS